METQKTQQLLKTPTGIDGLDEITEGGFPKGRPTLVCGSAGCGKTLMALQFLVKGITEYGENGVFMSFEESESDLTQNVDSLGFNLNGLVARKKLRIDNVIIERSEIDETGEYDLEGIFIRLNHAIDSIGAKRVVLDTIESIFGGMENTTILRSEIRRLFSWLKKKGVTTIITGERGDRTLTRQGLEEYVSDCVILLDFRVNEQIATRRLRIVKYRGSTHGTNEYPFLINSDGISVLPITSLRLDHLVSKEIISTGLSYLDELLSTGGLFRGSTTLVTGTAGTSKTILATYFAQKSCLRKEKVLYFSFEESPEQIVRNMKTIGINLVPFIKSKLLYIHSSRPSLQGLEMHLLMLHKLIRELKPKSVVIDPISSLITAGSDNEVRSMLVRLIDYLKANQVTAFFTSLTHPKESAVDDFTVTAVSSLADTWIELKNEIQEDKRKRTLFIVKSRGMGHLNEFWTFTITPKGILPDKSSPIRAGYNSADKAIKYQ